MAAPTFSPAGLYLSGIVYDSKWNLPHPDQNASTAGYLQIT
jgi:hypothetical protein